LESIRAFLLFFDGDMNRKNWQAHFRNPSIPEDKDKCPLNIDTQALNRNAVRKAQRDALTLIQYVCLTPLNISASPTTHASFHM
jgi:hypothetical protein